MWEQEEYKKEGIDWSGVTFADNKPVLVRSIVQHLLGSVHKLVFYIDENNNKIQVYLSVLGKRQSECKVMLNPFTLMI